MDKYNLKQEISEGDRAGNLQRRSAARTAPGRAPGQLFYPDVGLAGRFPYDGVGDPGDGHAPRALRCPEQTAGDGVAARRRGVGRAGRFPEGGGPGPPQQFRAPELA